MLERQTDGRTDKVNYRVASLLKTGGMSKLNLWQLAECSRFASFKLFIWTNMTNIFFEE